MHSMPAVALSPNGKLILYSVGSTYTNITNLQLSILFVEFCLSHCLFVYYNNVIIIIISSNFIKIQNNVHL